MAYLIQIDNEIREATRDEIIVIETVQNAAAEQEALLAAKNMAKQSARTKLAALGLTDAEIAALVG